MSLLTRCSQCAAVYQVADDQLRISGGWVRCGQCGHVFEAATQQIDPLALEPSVEQQSGNAPSPAQPTTVQIDWPVESGVETNAIQPSDASAPAAQVDQQPTSQPMLVKESAHDLLPQQLASSASTASPTRERGFKWQAPQSGAGNQLAARRWGLMLISVLLLLMAWMQWLYWDRDHLASMRPELKPMLQRWCKPIGCQVSAMRSVDAVVIDASTFTMAGKDTYRLGFVLKNNALSPVAVPHIELTLTDSLEHVLVRRVLTPAELGAPDDALQAGAQWPVTAVLRLQLQQDQARVLGYHLLAFYP